MVAGLCPHPVRFAALQREPSMTETVVARAGGEVADVDRVCQGIDPDSAWFLADRGGRWGLVAAGLGDRVAVARIDHRDGAVAAVGDVDRVRGRIDGELRVAVADGDRRRERRAAGLACGVAGGGVDHGDGAVAEVVEVEDVRRGVGGDPDGRRAERDAGRRGPAAPEVVGVTGACVNQGDGVGVGPGVPERRSSARLPAPAPARVAGGVCPQPAWLRPLQAAVSRTDTVPSSVLVTWTVCVAASTNAGDGLPPTVTVAGV
jgi:hypothetical protein